jgi:polyisoprenoid-binding protein YceI
MVKRIGWRRLLALVWLLALVSAQAQAETARYNVDLDHSTVEFRVAHMVVSKTTGRFMDYNGFIEMDPEVLTVKTIEAEIKTASVNTNHQKRDTHLRSADFFNVEKYPVMTYKLKSYRRTGDDYTAVGDLTLLGVTREIALVGKFNGVAKDPWGNVRAGFTAEGKFNRKDFGMNWSKTLDNGGLVVGDEVQIKLDIECIKAKSPEGSTQK